jgi:hypothetical protein
MGNANFVVKSRIANMRKGPGTNHAIVVALRDLLKNERQTQRMGLHVVRLDGKRRVDPQKLLWGW